MDEIKTCPVCGSPVPIPKVKRSRVYCSNKCLDKSKKTRYRNNLSNVLKGREYARQYCAKNKEKIKNYQLLYRKANQSFENKRHHEYYIKTKEERKNKRKANYIKVKENLPDYFIASRLEMSVKDIPKTLIHLKRAQVQIARTLKELNDVPSKSNKRG